MRRGAERAHYDHDTVHAILDAGMIAHVGVQTPDGPLVLPMAYGRDDETLYLHGALANHLLGSGEDHQVCATVTLVDGLVMARTPLHNSMNYRSVVIRGRAERIDDPELKARVLEIITDHVVPNWGRLRPPTESEIRKTLVVRVPLAEASAKERSGDPVDDPDDLSGPWWAGVVPIATRFGPASSSADLTSGADIPGEIGDLDGVAVDERP